MRILALEFSTRLRSVAVWDTDAPPGTAPVVACESAARATPVFSLIETALRNAGLDRKAIERIAVGLGPGSATGIRAAIAVAQGWHLARGVTVVGRNSLDVVAAGLPAGGMRGLVYLVSDAQRGEWHVARYELGASAAMQVEPFRLVPHEQLRAWLQAGETVLGPDAAAALPGARDAFPEAATLARLAAQVAPDVPPERLEPVHLRAPAFVKASLPVVPEGGSAGG